MKGNWCRIAVMAAGMLLVAGCRATDGKTQQEPAAQEAEGELEEFFLSAEDAGDVPIVVSEYAEETEYPALASFLISYYQIPDEYQSETRYYYNYIDLNDDGTEELFAFVVGEYTEVSFGDPALILTEEADGSFTVLETFEGVHTPILISENTTNGWHDIIYNEYGMGTEDGYRICHYNPEGGYQTELSEVVEESPSQGGTQILSNNLIDDMDKGNYLTLAPREEE